MEALKTFIISSDSFKEEGKPSIIVSGLCLESYPCQHSITINGVKTSMYGNVIYQLLKENGYPTGHFEMYANYSKLF